MKYLYPVFAILFFAGLLTACSTTGNSVETVSETDAEWNLVRPIPYPIEIPLNFTYAVDQGTRTTTGKPGVNYFTNYAHYDLKAVLSPADTMLYGEAKITYFNHSPDTLTNLIFELPQNLHKAGVPRKEFAEITGGMDITRLSIGNEVLTEENRMRPTYIVRGTNMVIYPPENIAPNDSVTVEINWNFKIPQSGASGRMGYSKDNLFYIAYWYPHVATYDDLQGWFGDNFTGNAEFYYDFADYNISITVPEQWVVMSTGAFLNPAEVLAPYILERYQKATTSDTPVSVAAEDDFGTITKTREDDALTWRFRAEKVRDVAFSATLESNWDALRTPVGDLDEDGETDYTLINAFWRNTAPYWKDAADHTAHAISFLSEYTSLSYPWPHMTSVEGADIIGGGMEFPMMTIVGSYNNAGSEALYDVIAHELAHMWIPMMVSTNERRHAWMDEGATSYHESLARKDRFPERYSRFSEFNRYVQLAGTTYEGEIMRWSDYHYPGPAYLIASYPKPASVLIALQGVLGDELFHEAWTTFMKRWAYKHPTPIDMFNTFEDVSGQDLDWFWRSWYYETWILDQGISNVQQQDGKATITIQDYGEIPMPVDLTVTFDDGSQTETRISVEDWLNGKRSTSTTIEIPSNINRIEIDAGVYYPDVNRANNIWTP